MDFKQKVNALMDQKASTSELDSGMQRFMAEQS